MCCCLSFSFILSGLNPQLFIIVQNTQCLKCYFPTSTSFSANLTHGILEHFSSLSSKVSSSTMQFFSLFFFTSVLSQKIVLDILNKPNICTAFLILYSVSSFQIKHCFRYKKMLNQGLRPYIAVNDCIVTCIFSHFLDSRHRIQKMASLKTRSTWYYTKEYGRIVMLTFSHVFLNFI